MASGCRDCVRCTESGFTGCLMMPIRLTLWICGGFLVSFFRKNCPQCSHAMAQHQRLRGRLAD